MDAIKPDYEGACIVNVASSLLGEDLPDWFPEPVRDASAILLFLLDGLGWNAFEEMRGDLPVLSSLEGSPITSVVPSSTASALTSVTTGLSPSQHGLVGYRMRVGPEILNVLGWFYPGGSEAPDPQQIQPAPSFAGRQVKIVTRSQFVKSGFSEASMRGARLIGWRTTSTLVEHCRRLGASGERFFYAYYDGVDLVAHQYGLKNDFFAAEVRAADRLIGEVIEVLPPGCAVVIVSDHGQVHLDRKSWIPLEACDPYAASYAGDGRFRFIYAKSGASSDLLKAAEECVGEKGWVFSREQLIEEGWLGPRPEPWIRDRIGDVTLAARDAVAFIDPTNPLEVNLQSGHGSLTEREMLVPLLAGRGRGP